MTTTKTPVSFYKIRFSDCDPFGHLNNSRYLDYMLDAREDHLLKIHAFDFTQHYKTGLAWVVVSHEIAYVKPALYNEMVAIQSVLLEAQEEFVHVEIMMMNEKQTQLKAIMRTRFVPINITTGKKELHKPDFLTWAKTLETSEISAQITLHNRIQEVLALLKRN